MSEKERKNWENMSNREMLSAIMEGMAVLQAKFKKFEDESHEIKGELRRNTELVERNSAKIDEHTEILNKHSKKLDSHSKALERLETEVQKNREAIERNGQRINNIEALMIEHSVKLKKIDDNTAEIQKLSLRIEQINNILHTIIDKLNSLSIDAEIVLD